MDEPQRTALTVAEQTIERANGSLSRQSRYNGKVDPDAMGLSLLRFHKLGFMDQPDYSADSRKRDKWLRDFWKMEPHLKGVVNSVVAIDKNRGWTLTGGRNQVKRFTTILHNANDGAGWRNYASQEATSFYTTDMNAVSEVGRDGIGGPLRALYHVDPTRCVLTGNGDTPLKYYPARGKMERWPADVFFRVASLPSDDEAFNGLGYCAVSRCVELAQIMLSIYEHDKEMLGARAPRGLLLLQNINQDQWDQAMAAREASLDTAEQKYYGAVAVLAQMGVDQVDAKLVALSQLPANFDIKIMTDLLMYGYALAFGYDPSEFWPVNFGSLGRGTETQVQHGKATAKGGLDFALGYQEQLQNNLPDTIQFEFEQRDDAGELTAANVAMAKLDVVAKMYETGLLQGASLISRDEARTLLADQGLIPPEWTATEEDVTSTDTEANRMRRLRQRAMEQPQIRAAIAQSPNEPIIRYEWPRQREIMLWERGDDAIRRSAWVIDEGSKGNDETQTATEMEA